MKLQQLHYIWEVAHHDLNVSATAQILYTSQPGISKQIRLLEDELGVEIFIRSGKHLVQVSPAGEKILQVAGEVLQQIESIKYIAQEFSEPNTGSLDIAASDVAASFVLPKIVAEFIEVYPKVKIRVNQNTPRQVIQKASEGDVNLGFATVVAAHPGELILLPSFKWRYVVVVGKDHPLTLIDSLTLAHLAEYPLIVYVTGTVTPESFEDVFSSKGLSARLVCSATDAEIVKSYVREGMGVGIIPTMSFDRSQDRDLVAMDTKQLFSANTTNISLCKKGCLRGYMYDFIEAISPHLTRDVLAKAFVLHNCSQRDEFMASFDIVEY